jgi:AraC-like DNA-binding protein
MAIFLNETDWDELCKTAQQCGESIFQETATSIQLNFPPQLGKGEQHIIFLRDGLILQFGNGELCQDFHIKKYHEGPFPLTSKFFISGNARVRTAGVPSVIDEYEEVTGQHYLYCLPELTEIEEWKAEEPIQIVMVYANLDYFQHFEPNYPILPVPLRQILKAESIQPFHYSLGRTTLAMKRVLQQILACPYQGWMQHLYLEGKALELLALQFAQWVEPERPLNQPILLKSDDVECLHAARKILMQRASNPPSLLELARQVGLNDYKLKQGFLQVFGTTVFGYLHDYRLERSQQLLASSEMSVTEVAHAVGYASLPSFSKAFRKKFDNSPTAYTAQRNAKKIRLG